MKTEIEMKAWVNDPKRLKVELDNRCTFLREFFKDDSYFKGPAVGPAPGQEFRLRRDDGPGVCTFKDRVIKDGVEINAEGEFTVSDPEMFLRLMARLGAEPFVAKKKRGRAYAHDGLTIELHEVEDLGNFIEVECVLESPTEEEAAATQEKIRGFLLSVGVGAEQVEATPYTRLLLAKVAKAGGTGP